LSDQEKKWLQEAADESYQYEKKLWLEATLKALEEVKKAGVKIYYPDKSLFEKKVEPLIKEFESDKEMSDLIQKIKAIK
jgi:TRAP-type C4-dicarboxylate transport system substrate-binding protein